MEIRELKFDIFSSQGKFNNVKNSKKDIKFEKILEGSKRQDKDLRKPVLKETKSFNQKNNVKSNRQINKIDPKEKNIKLLDEEDIDDLEQKMDEIKKNVNVSLDMIVNALREILANCGALDDGNEKQNLEDKLEGIENIINDIKLSILSGVINKSDFENLKKEVKEILKDGKLKENELNDLLSKLLNIDISELKGDQYNDFMKLIDDIMEALEKSGLIVKKDDNVSDLNKDMKMTDINQKKFNIHLKDELNNTSNSNKSVSNENDNDKSLNENNFNNDAIKKVDVKTIDDLTNKTKPIKEELVFKEEKNDDIQGSNKLNVFEHLNMMNLKENPVMSLKPTENLMLQKSVMSQVIDNITELKTVMNAGEKVSEVMVKLYPRNLGSVSLKMAFERGELIAQIEVDNNTVKGIMESNLADLKQSLNQGGYNLAELNVSVKKDNSHKQLFEANSSKRRILKIDDSDTDFVENYNVIETKRYMYNSKQIDYYV